MNFKFYEPRFSASKPLHDEKPQSVKDLRLNYDDSSKKTGAEGQQRLGQAKNSSGDKTSVFDKLNYPKNARPQGSCGKRHATVGVVQAKPRNRSSKEMTVINLDSSLLDSHEDLADSSSGFFAFGSLTVIPNLSSSLANKVNNESVIQFPLLYSSSFIRETVQKINAKEPIKNISYTTQLTSLNCNRRISSAQSRSLEHLTSIDNNNNSPVDNDRKKDQNALTIAKPIVIERAVSSNYYFYKYNKSIARESVQTSSRRSDLPKVGHFAVKQSASKKHWPQ